jgi:hypothetical protein
MLPSISKSFLGVTRSLLGKLDIFTTQTNIVYIKMVTKLTKSESNFTSKKFYEIDPGIDVIKYFELNLQNCKLNCYMFVPRALKASSLTYLKLCKPLEESPANITQACSKWVSG